MGMPDAPPKQKLVTQAQYDAALADFEKNYKTNSATDVAALFDSSAPNRERDQALQSLKDSMLVAPPPAPDLSDDLVTKARAAARRRLLQGNALVGPIDTTPAAAPIPGLTGY